MGNAFLLADIGGTNSRLALSDGGAAPSRVQSFRNDDFDSGYGVIDAYLSGLGRPVIGGCALAMAGPADTDGIHLTNRDWHIDRAGITATLQDGFAGPMAFLNDLMALGYATYAMEPGQTRPLHPGFGFAKNGQSFVLACGTGINGSQAVHLGNKVVACECDIGPSAVPSQILGRLMEETGGRFDPATMWVEEILSGRGVLRLYSLVSGKPADLTGPQIMARAVPPGTETDDPAARTVALLCELAAWIIHELTFFYRPADGFFLGGSVFRALLDSAAGEALVQHYDTLGQRPLTLHPPLSLITDDLAPLSGLALLASELAEG